MTKLLVTVSFLGLLVFVAFLSAYFPKPLITLSFATMGAYFLLQNRHLPYVLLIVGSFFDETHVSVGFALLGGGDLGILIFVPIWAIRKWAAGHQRFWNLPIGSHLLIMYYAMVTMSLLLGETGKLAYGQYLRHGIYIFTFFAFTDELKEYKKIKISMYTLIACSTVHAIFAQIIDNPNARYEGLVDQSNLLGFLIGVGLVLSITLMHMRSSYKSKMLLMIVICACLPSFILTVSRGSYIALSMALLFYYRKQWRTLVFWGGAIAVVMSALYWLDEDRFQYILRRLEFQDRSVTNRWALVFNQLQMIQTYPFFGIGFGQFTQVGEVLQIELEAGRGSHNFYLGLCSSVGLIAAYFIFSFVSWQARGLWHSISEMKNNMTTSDVNERILFQALQALIVFHSCSLIFRGNKRMIEWVPLALYAASGLYYRNKVKQQTHQTN